jgi:hypothetical protein
MNVSDMELSPVMTNNIHSQINYKNVSNHFLKKNSNQHEEGKQMIKDKLIESK